ncbi:MAG: RNA polymerase sigma factor [Candidatus Saccharibacteria bacterium]
MKNGKENIDHDLLARLQKGEMQAFDKVYELYCHKLFSFVLKIVKSEADADDIVQEVFVKIWESRHKLEDYHLLNSYIFTIAYNGSIDLLRKRISSHKYIEHLKKSSVGVQIPDSVDEVEYKEFLNHVEKLISSLPERQKQVYLLHREQGLTYPEIADRLSISKNTVENHMGKALTSLRQKVSHALLNNILFTHLFL